MFWRASVLNAENCRGGAGRAHGGAGAARRSWVSSCASRRAARSAEPGGVHIPCARGGSGGADHERHRCGARVDDALGDVADVAGAAAPRGGVGRRAGGLDRCLLGGGERLVGGGARLDGLAQRRDGWVGASTMVLSPTSASPYFCTVACPAASASVSWARVGTASSPAPASASTAVPSPALSPAREVPPSSPVAAAFARSRQNTPNSGPQVPPTTSQPLHSAVSRPRWVVGASVSGRSATSFMAVRTLVPKSPSPARRSRSPSASAAPSRVSCTPRTKRRPVSSGRVWLLVISVSSPGQGRGADGGGPELRLLVLQRHQGDRDAVHVEAGHVGADEGAFDGDPR